MQVNFMSSQQVWPQLAAPPVSELQSQLQSQPLLQAARGGYPDGSFGPLALGPLAAPLQLRTMFDCGGGDCTLHTGSDVSTTKKRKDDEGWWVDVKHNFCCNCDLVTCVQQTVHCLY
jgi:hypothetical protein